MLISSPVSAGVIVRLLQDTVYASNASTAAQVSTVPSGRVGPFPSPQSVVVLDRLTLLCCVQYLENRIERLFFPVCGEGTALPSPPHSLHTTEDFISSFDRSSLTPRPTANLLGSFSHNCCIY